MTDNNSLDISDRDKRIAALEAEVAALKALVHMEGGAAGVISLEKQAKIPSKKKRIAAKIGGGCFYLFMIAAIVAALMLGGGGKLHEIGGYSVLRVLSDSMKSVMPRGSIVLIQRTDPANIAIGDDITYMTDDKKLVTHRVEDIYSNYQDTGYRGFVTKGVNNSVPDPDIVYEVNIVGKVIWHNNTVGQALGWIRSNLTAALVIAGMIPLVALLIYIMRLFFKPEKLQNNL
jgi:signal peptidase